MSSIVDISNIKKKGGGGVLGISCIEAIQNILLGNSMGFVTLSIITWVEKQRSKAKWRIESCILMVDFCSWERLRFVKKIHRWRESGKMKIPSPVLCSLGDKML